MVQENRLKVQFTSLGELRESTTVSGLVASCCKITIDNHDNSGHIFEVSVPLYITLNPLPCFRKFPPTFLKHFFRFLARAPCAAPKLGSDVKFYGRNSAKKFRRNSENFQRISAEFLLNFRRISAVKTSKAYCYMPEEFRLPRSTDAQVFQ